MDISSLTTGQTLFLHGMLTHGKKGQAAIDAGYSPHSASTQACEMLKNPIISKVLVDSKIKIIDDAMEEAKIDAAWVLHRLKEMAEANLFDFIKINKNGVPSFDFSQVTREQMSMVEALEVSPGEHGVKIKVKIPNKKQIIETIGKHTTVEAFKERVELFGNVHLNFDKEDEDA